MKATVDRARDLFFENPNQTAEEVACALVDEYKEVVGQRGITAEELYKYCLESANLVVRVRELLEKRAKAGPFPVQERVQELVKKGSSAEGEYEEFMKTVEPDITPERLKNLVLQFRCAVSDQQSDLSALPN
jgi:hypothetical protein